MWARAFGPGLAHRRAGREVESLHRGRGQQLRGELAARLPAFGDYAAHGAPLAEMTGEAPGVDALEHRNASLGEPRVEAQGGAPVGGMPAELAHHDAGDLRTT